MKNMPLKVKIDYKDLQFIFSDNCHRKYHFNKLIS